MVIKKFRAPLAVVVLLLASTLTWARGPEVRVVFEDDVLLPVGKIEVSSLTIKGPRGKRCDASKTTVSIVRNTDEDSPELFKAVATGELYDTVIIYFAGAQFRLEDVQVTSFTTNGGDPPSETLTLSPAGISPRQGPGCDKA